MRRAQALVSSQRLFCALHSPLSAAGVLILNGLMDHPPALDAILPPVTLHVGASPGSPLILASPHAGRDYRPDFLKASRLDPRQLRRTEDAFVDLLFQEAPALGVSLLCANFPRAWVDVNREQWELDPTMFDAPLPPFAVKNSPRVAVGLGVIPKVAGQGALIYPGKLTLAEAEERLSQAWRPYHRALEDLIEQTRRQFGWCLLIDCHSMPKPSVALPDAGPDVILGDAFGTSCRSDLVLWCEEYLQAAGYRLRRNAPYAGGYVTRHYGRPATGVHVLQLEIARELYMDEATLEPSAQFKKMRRNCTGFIAALVEQLAGLTD
jgi:N-formylglutamate amidohydrolase